MKRFLPFYWNEIGSGQAAETDDLPIWGGGLFLETTGPVEWFAVRVGQ